MNKSPDVFQSKVRIKDIAERANVSVGTVDRVLHNRGEVAQETRDLISKIINELEYKPNIIASTLALKKPFVVGILMPLPQESDSYWQLHLKGIDAAIKEYNFLDVKLKKYYFEINSEESLRLQFDQLLESKPDAVLMVPMFGQSGSKIAHQLAENKIPYVYLDIANEDGKEHNSIGQDAFQGGYVAANLMTYGVNKEMTVLIVSIGTEYYSNPHCANRVKGFKAYLADHNITETKVRTIDIPTTNEADVKKYMNAAFLDYSFVRGLFITGSEVHRIAKFVDEKKLGNIRIVGFDLLESNINYLKKGTVDFLITQKPERQGYLGMTNLLKTLVLKQPNNPPKPIPIDIITRENVDYHRD